MKKFKDIHLEVSERKLLLRLFDIFSVLLSLYLCRVFFQFDYFNISSTNYSWTIVLGFYLIGIGSVFEMYNLQVASNQFQVIKSSILTASTTVLVYLLTPIYTPGLPSNRIQILIFFIAIFGALFLWRMVYVRFFASNRFLKKVVLVCDQDQLEELVKGLVNVDPHYRVLGYVNSDGNTNKTDLKKIKNIPIDLFKSFVVDHSISEIVVASQKTDGITVELYNQLIDILETGFFIREYTQVYESLTQRVPVQYVSRDFYRYFPFSRSNQNQLYLFVVRLSEVVIAAVGLLIGILLTPLIALGNVLFNKGKLFYTQERVGKNGEIFNIVKFRTMIKNAEKEGAVFATANDTRITPFGKILRKSRLDEFPQFINILKGDMAVIGPRPERPIFVKEIAERMPFYETRHVIKPGLTGWAQVNYSYGATIEDSLIKLQYDLYYIKHRSLFLDVSIILKTLSTVLFYRGQ
jgi:exopolysaccharide biosynthesis polyprenyl glycosylphosphotransferase